MNNEVRKEIIEVLKTSVESLKNDDVRSLRDLSNRVINSSSVFQDESIITIAIVTYSLSKIYERTDYRKYPGWHLFHETTANSLREALFALEKNDLEIFEKNLKNIMNIIERLDKKLKDYIKDVVKNSQIGRGSRLHEHGLSLGRTAELLGINKWELLEYIGKTGIADIKEGLTLGEEKRLKIARGLFQ